MIPQEIKETNKLIAHFMGATIWRHTKDGEIPKLPGSICEYMLRELKYDTSWDWLMPVINKIALIGMEEHCYNHTAGIVASSHVCCSVTTVYERVINFINTYNETNNITPSLTRI